MNNLLLKIKHSPFLIAGISGLVITLADIAWMTGELLTHFGILTIQDYVYYRLVILSLLILGVIILCGSIVRYLKSGYSTVECKHEKEHRQKALRNRRLNRIK